MPLRPIGGHIIVEPKEKEMKTASGIYLPETGEQERQEQGKVIAVGPGKFLDNGTRQVMEVRVGDTVIFKSYGPSEVKIESKNFLVVAAEDVVAIVE